jgi:trk system potassium uptake protein TrkH
MTFGSRILKLHFAILVLASFFLAITIDAFLLILPISATNGDLVWMDSLFTVTSAVCITGFAMVVTDELFFHYRSVFLF